MQILPGNRYYRSSVLDIANKASTSLLGRVVARRAIGVYKARTNWHGVTYVLNAAWGGDGPIRSGNHVTMHVVAKTGDRAVHTSSLTIDEAMKLAAELVYCATQAQAMHDGNNHGAAHSKAEDNRERFCEAFSSAAHHVATYCRPIN